MSLITLDFETYYGGDYTLKSKKMSTESYIRDARFQAIGVSARVDNAPAVWATGQAIGPLLRSLDIPRHTMLAHHAAFDGAILSWHYNIIPKYYACTLSMARPVHGLNVGGSLKALAKVYGLQEKGTEVERARGKRLEDFTPEQLAEYGQYCITDNDICYQLYHLLKQHSTPQEMYIIDMMIRMYTDPVLVLNKPILQDHLAKVLAHKVTLMSRIDSTIGKEALRSNPQFAKLLESLGVDPPMKLSAATGKMTYAFAKTDAAFKELLEHEDVTVQLLVAARLGIKTSIEETRTQAFINIADRGTLPIMLNYWGAHPGRASGGDKINPQNLPRGGRLRFAIQAPAGHVIVAGDSSQIEARLLAWFAGEFELVSDFRSGIDVYSKFATKVYGREITAADILERFLGKTCILGLGYGTGHVKLRATLRAGKNPVIVELEESKRIVDLYRSDMVMIRNLWKLCDEALDSMVRGFECELGVHMKLRCTPEGIHLPNGMMIRYPNIRRNSEGDVIYDSRYGTSKLYGAKMVENFIQGLARIVVFNQMAKMDQWLRELDLINPTNGTITRSRFKLAHSVHDEIVTVCPISHQSQVVQKMQETMRIAPKWAESLPLACEVGAAVSYGQAK